MNLHYNLKKSREKKKFSQNEIAEKLNLTRQTISRWENGRSFPDIDNLIKLSNLYDVSLDELLKNEKKLHKENPEYEINDKNQTYLILSVISILIPLGIVVAVFIIINIFIKHNRTYKNIILICAISVIINIIKIIINGHMILFR